MTEMTKTMAYLGTAVVVLVVAWISRPAPATFDANEMVGKNLYDFDPLTARRLKIVNYDTLTGEPRAFEVARIGDTWSIPSKDGYPADAEDQMADAAGAINGKQVLRVASENARDHQLYGVLDPTSEDRNVGEEGIGTRVTILDDAGKTLADLIVGKEVKDAPEHRYVRPTGRDIVVVAEIDPEKLSTNFEDWIEKDLLKLSPWDVQKVRIKDYSAEIAIALRNGRPVPVLQEDPRADMTLAYDDSESKWVPERMLVFDHTKGDDGDYVEQPLGENEELATTELNDLKNALDDLRIVDVERKPEGLSADLKASDDFLNSNEALSSLQSYGFVPMPSPSGDGLELVSTDGEVIVTMKTGVEYVLRFGEVAIDSHAQSQADATASDASDDGEAEPSGDLNRYIFVLARFNEYAIEKPEFETPPDLPEGIDEVSIGKAEEAADAEPETDGATEADEAATDAAENDEDAATNDDSAAADEADDEASETERILEERKRIEEANQRKRDEYEDKIKKGKETVQELNERFGDWYYVVDNAEYQRIHLSRDQIVKEKETDEDADADSGSDTAAPAIDAGGFGKPGEAFPGLPSVPGTLEDETETTDTNSLVPTEE